MEFYITTLIICWIYAIWKFGLIDDNIEMEVLLILIGVVPIVNIIFILIVLFQNKK